MRKKTIVWIICLVMLVPYTVYGVEADGPMAPADPAKAGGSFEQTDMADAASPEEITDLMGPASHPDVSAEPAADMEDLLVVQNNKGGASSLEKIDEDSYDGFLYVLKDDTPQRELHEMDENIADLDGDQYVDEVSAGEIYAADSLETIDEVTDPDTIEYIEPNYIRHLDTITDEGSGNKKNTANYRLISTDLLWDYGITGQGVKVAILDSGVTGLKGGKVKHQDLNYKKITRGTTYAYRNIYTGSRYRKSYGNDDNGHGTFVTGEIAAKMNNGKGIVGLASGVRIISIKVSNKQGGLYDADIIKGLKQAKKKGAKVVNMSFSGTNRSASIERVCDNLADSGIFLIAAAGNLGDTTHLYPASYDSVISVGAVDSSGNRTSYSEHNNKLDCAAPGNYYGLGKKKKNSCRSLKGTSMAAPVVTSYAAIVKSLKPDCTLSEFRTILKKTCTDRGSTGKDNQYGYGIVNFRAMYQYLTGTWLYPKEGADVADMYSDYKSGSYYYYTGSPIRPAYNIDYLIEGTDYTVTYEDNIEVGTAKIIVQGIGKYTGTLTKTFRIVPR